MECITISTPLIAHPDSDRDWDEQSVFRLPQVKQPTPYMPLTRNAPVDTTKRRQVRHVRRHTVQNIRISASGIQKRVRFDRSAVAVKPVTTFKNNHTTTTTNRTRKEWEDLLKSSINGLQGLYNKMDNTPPAKSSPVLGDRLPKPDLSIMDRTDMAFRALQIASGSNPVSPSQYQTEEYDGDMSSGSEDSFDSYDTETESPATPRSARMGSEESMDLDTGFMGMGIKYSV